MKKHRIILLLLSVSTLAVASCSIGPNRNDDVPQNYNADDHGMIDKTLDINNDYNSTSNASTVQKGDWYNHPLIIPKNVSIQSNTFNYGGELVTGDSKSMSVAGYDLSNNEAAHLFYKVNEGGIELRNNDSLFVHINQVLNGNNLDVTKWWNYFNLNNTMSIFSYAKDRDANIWTTNSQTLPIELTSIGDHKWQVAPTIQYDYNSDTPDNQNLVQEYKSYVASATNSPIKTRSLSDMDSILPKSDSDFALYDSKNTIVTVPDSFSKFSSNDWTIFSTAHFDGHLKQTQAFTYDFSSNFIVTQTQANEFVITMTNSKTSLSYFQMEEYDLDSGKKVITYTSPQIATNIATYSQAKATIPNWTSDLDFYKSWRFNSLRNQTSDYYSVIGDGQYTPPTSYKQYDGAFFTMGATYADSYFYHFYKKVVTLTSYDKYFTFAEPSYDNLSDLKTGYANYSVHQELNVVG